MAQQPSPNITHDQIREALSPFGISLNTQQLRQLRDYMEVLRHWNRTMSLTTVTEPQEIVRRHFGESMFALKLPALRLLPVENCRLADVGTGAGFPGLALKIANPSMQLVLIESNKKKCAFLAEVVRALGLVNVEIRSERFEEVPPESIRVNVVAARAVGEFKRLLKWSEGALANGGILVLWLGAEDSDRVARSASHWAWQPAVRIPESQRRFLLVGSSPVRSLGETPDVRN